MNHFGLASLALLFCGVLASSVRADDGKLDSKLPAVDIVKAIINSEESNSNAEYPETGHIDWDPYIDPDFSRSKLYIETPSEVLDNLELNKDQQGKPLFP